MIKHLGRTRVCFGHGFRFEKSTASRNPGLSEIVGESLIDKIHSDPRWRPFLRKIAKAPEQLAQIKFKVTLPP
ncbi:MAG: hypothetical protein M3N48_02815 [Verrucomicrobiota bacterium]|nr:hypothetical protein [Verrucomicrobiota bacterium]